jgi:hypothetical protein
VSEEFRNRLFHELYLKLFSYLSYKVNHIVFITHVMKPIGHCDNTIFR